HMIATAVAHDAGPIAFRYPRGSGVGIDLPDRGQVLEIGKGRIVREGTDLAILSFGAQLGDAMVAAERLEAEGVHVTVADARFAKPLDTEMIDRLAREHGGLITLEQGSDGGFGSAVLHHLARAGRLDNGLAVRPMTLPDRFIHQASPAEMYADAGLTVEHICQTASEILRLDRKIVELPSRA
ncbi:MAG: transketolase C-terminal domain-containing protein, partial [Pseudomonadota bacterium]